MARAAVVAIGAAGEALFHALHEPRQRAQARARGVDPHRVGGLLGDLAGAPRHRTAVGCRAQMGARPARGDLDGGPGVDAMAWS